MSTSLFDVIDYDLPGWAWAATQTQTVEDRAEAPFWQPRHVGEAIDGREIGRRLWLDVVYIVTGEGPHVGWFDRYPGLDFAVPEIYDGLGDLRTIVLSPVESDRLLFYLQWAFGYDCPDVAVLPLRSESIYSDVALCAFELASRKHERWNRQRQDASSTDLDAFYERMIYNLQPGLFVSDLEDGKEPKDFPAAIRDLYSGVDCSLLIVGFERDVRTLQLEILRASTAWGILSLPDLARMIGDRETFHAVMRRPWRFSDIPHGSSAFVVHRDIDELHLLDRERDIERHRRERRRREQRRAMRYSTPQQAFPNSAPSNDVDAIEITI